MAVFCLLFLAVALVLIGVGIVVGLVACGLAAILVAAGVLSSSVVVGILTRRAEAGFQIFLLQSAIIAGIPAGMVCAWVAHSLLGVVGTEWFILLYGAIGGAIAGLVIALFLNFIFRQLHRWAFVKLHRPINV